MEDEAVVRERRGMDLTVHGDIHTGYVVWHDPANRRWLSGAHAIRIPGEPRHTAWEILEARDTTRPCANSEVANVAGTRRNGVQGASLRRRQEFSAPIEFECAGAQPLIHGRRSASEV